MATVKGPQIGLMGRDASLGKGLQVFRYVVQGGGTLDSGDDLILDEVPFAFMPFETRVYVKTAHGAALTADLGHGYWDGTTYTAIDQDSIAAGVNLNASAGGNTYPPPNGTSMGIVPGGSRSNTAHSVHVIALHINGAITNTSLVAEVMLVIDPVQIPR